MNITYDVTKYHLYHRPCFRQRNNGFFRELLGLAGEGKPTFEFKWIDSIGLDDVMNFYRDGDAAPFGRFNFIY